MSQRQTSALCIPGRFREERSTNTCTSGNTEAFLAVEPFSREAQVDVTFVLNSCVVKCGDESMQGLDTEA